MEIKFLSIKELNEKLKNQEITISQLTNLTIKNLKEEMSSNFLVTLTEDHCLERAKELEKTKNFDNPLYGIPYVTKDNISTKDILTTGSSRILSNYYPTFDATITETLDKSGAILCGKATLDELGMGGTGLFAFNGEVRNPLDKERIIGGSSSGSAFAVATGLVPYSTGTDTGDSIRKPASYTGIVGFKPTYGSISRYGVIPYSPSLDHVGFFTRSVEDMAILCDVSFGLDHNDFTSIDNKQSFSANLNEKKEKIKFGFLTSVEKYMDKSLLGSYEKLFDKVKKDGHEVIFVDFKKELLDAITAVYMMISFSEGATTHANLDGINFGKREKGQDYLEIMRNSRSKNFGSTVKRRFVIGSFQLKKENQERLLAKSKKVRRLINEELSRVYEEIDILILPPSLNVAPKVSEVLGTDVEERDNDEKVFLEDLLILANFNGMPSITLPFIKSNGLPIGINLNARPKNDLELLQVSKYIEEVVAKQKNGGETND